MSLSINNFTNGQLTTDRQKARATEFVNRNDREISQMAYRTHRIAHREDDKRFSQNMKATLLSLPAIALASGLAAKKGIKPSLKSSADWGIAVTAPALVTGASKAMSTPDANGKKHDKLPFGAHLVLSLASYFAGFAALDALSKNAKVNKVADTVIQGTKDTFGKVKNEIKVPEKVSKVFNKVVDATKPAMEKVAGTSIGKTAVKYGKKAVEHAPMLVALGMVGSIFGAAVKQSAQISSIKSDIKNAQLNTARNLIDAYKEENTTLKAENAKLEEIINPSEEA